MLVMYLNNNKSQSIMILLIGLVIWIINNRLIIDLTLFYFFALGKKLKYILNNVGISLTGMSVFCPVWCMPWWQQGAMSTCRILMEWKDARVQAYAPAAHPSSFLHNLSNFAFPSFSLGYYFFFGGLFITLSILFFSLNPLVCWNWWMDRWPPGVCLV